MRQSLRLSLGGPPLRVRVRLSDETGTQAAAAVGALGDSTTDGVGSTPDRNRRWTDRLAERLVARTGAAVPAVINLGLAGNTVTGGPVHGFRPPPPAR